MNATRYVALVANVAIVVVTGCIVLFLGPYIAQSRPGAEYHPGDLLEFAGDLKLNVPHSVVLFLDSRCSHCNASFRFYRRLVSARDESGAGAKIIAVTGEDEPSLARHLADNGLVLNAVHHLNRVPTRLKVTPMVLLVDESGRVVHTWVGRLSASAEQTLLRYVR
jgi:hypothetical protein